MMRCAINCLHQVAKAHTLLMSKLERNRFNIMHYSIMSEHTLQRKAHGCNGFSKLFYSHTPSTACGHLAFLVRSLVPHPLASPYQHMLLQKIETREITMGAIRKFNSLNPQIKALSVISLIVAIMAVFVLTFVLGRGASAGATSIALEDQDKGGLTRPTSSPMHPTRAPTMQLSAVNSTTKPSTIVPSRPSTALPSKPHTILQPSMEMPCPPLFKKAKPTSVAEPSPSPFSSFLPFPSTGTMPTSQDATTFRTFHLRQGETLQPTQTHSRR